MKDNNVIFAEGIEKTFKDFWGRPKVKALRGVDLKVREGSVFGLLGPNGAGKSTLIKLLLGHLYPTAGQLEIFGKSAKSVESKLRLGYLPERSYMYKNLTAKETLHYFGEILKLDKPVIKERTEQLLDMVGLENAANRLVGSFSHGMTRRIGLAQALLNAPDLLILDEPTAGMDPVGCREVKDLIIEVAKQGKTVLVTSHLLADTQDVCDEFNVMFGGKVQVQGKKDELLKDLDTTTLNFPKVSAETLKKAQAVLREELGDKAIEETAPTQSLEEYFLKIVSDAHANNQETSGAELGKGVAEFLKKG